MVDTLQLDDLLVWDLLLILRHVLWVWLCALLRRLHNQLISRHSNLPGCVALLAWQGWQLHVHALSGLLLLLLLDQLFGLFLSLLRLLSAAIFHSAWLLINTEALNEILLLLHLCVDILVWKKLDFDRVLLASHLHDGVWCLDLWDLLSLGDRHVLVDLLGLNLLNVLLILIITNYLQVWIILTLALICHTLSDHPVLIDVLTILRVVVS